jgi:putative membrane protein (TIGR04086 family)
MQVDPRHSDRPTSPIHPTGFFTGVQIRPVILGVVVDYIATYAGMYAYIFLYLAKELGNEGEVSGDAIGKYLSTNEGLMISFIIGILGTALGGFIAGYKAGSFEIKHGAFVGLGSLIVSFIELLMHEDVPVIPEWFRMLSVLAVIPAGALGGYVAELFKGSATTPWGGAGRSP